MTTTKRADELKVGDVFQRRLVINFVRLTRLVAKYNDRILVQVEWHSAFGKNNVWRERTVLWFGVADLVEVLTP